MDQMIIAGIIIGYCLVGSVVAVVAAALEIRTDSHWRHLDREGITLVGLMSLLYIMFWWVWVTAVLTHWLGRGVLRIVSSMNRENNEPSSTNT